MASTNDTMTLDASQMIAELAKIQASFAEYNKTVGQAANVTVDITKKSKSFKTEFSLLSEEGIRYEGIIKKVNGELIAQVKNIRQTEEALTRARKAQQALNEESAKVKAQALIQSQTQITAAPVPERNIAGLRAAQAKLVQALSQDLKGGEAIAAEMFDKIRQGIVDVETGTRGKIQAAVEGVLRAERLISQELDKQVRLGNAQATNKVVLQRQTDAARAAQTFIGTQAGVSGAIPTQNINALRAAQAKLAQALGDDLSKSVPIADEIFGKLKRGIVDAETGVRLKLQTALTAVLRVSEQIAKTQAKLATPQAPAGTVQPAELTRLRQNLGQQFQIPTGASIGSVVSLQTAIDNLISKAAKSKLTFTELLAVINQIKSNPAQLGNFSPDASKVATQTQRVVAAYNRMKESAADASGGVLKSNRSMFLSFDQLVKLLEIQVIHRAFGAFATAMQQSIAEAAKLQVKLSEIRTVSQGAGLSFSDLQETVRNLSDQFGKPQADVAEAAYQGFSNQVLKTAGDMHVLTDVLNLARITQSTAAASMEAYSTVVNSYRLNNFEATRVTSELFKAVELGRFRLDQVASTYGRILPVAAQLNVSNAEASGLLAELTKNGVSADEALTQISSIMQALLKPSQAMSAVFRRLGVENGQAAIQSLGFVNVLQTLFEEAQKGNTELAALFPNVRALRGVLGGFGGGGADELRNTIDQIRNAQQSATAATQIISESSGDKVLKEFNKVQNFFLNDFGNTIIEAILKLSAPFGGLSEIVKGFGKAVLDTFQILVKFEQGLASVAAVFGITNISVEDVTKGFIAYKASILLLSTVQAIQTRIEQANAAARLASGIVTATQTNLFTLANISLTLNTAVTTISTATQAAWSSVVGFGNTVLSTAIALIYRDTAATVLAAAAQQAWTLATVAGAAATKALAIAWNLLPIVVIATSIFYLIGAFDGLIERHTAAGQSAIALRNQQSALAQQFSEERDRQNREQTEQSRLFTGDLNARVGAASRVLSSLQRAANELTDAQAEAVKQTEENVRESLDRVKRSMGESISELSRMISDFKKHIEASMKFQLTFKDREAARTFQSALAAAGETPELRTNVGAPVDPQTRQGQIERFQRTERTAAASRQQLLITERINQLTEEARQAQLSGDHEGIESARRKYEEIRRLIEQQENIRRGESRASALDQATDIARRTGNFVTVAYDGGLQRLQQRMADIQQLEEQAEQDFRSRQAQRLAEAENTRRKQLEAQAAFVEASRQLQQLTVTDTHGQVRERFRDRVGEQAGSGIARFEAEFQALQERLRQTARDAGADPAVVEGLIVQLGSREIALREQIQRQVTSNHIAEVSRRLRLEQEEIQRANTAAEGARNRALEAGRELIPRLPGQIHDIDVSSRQIIGVAGNRQGQETNQQLLARLELFTQARREFDNARAQIEASIQAVAESRGTEREAEATRRLQERVVALADAYQRMAGLGVGPAQLPGADAGITGNQAAAGGTVIASSASRLTEAVATLNQANIDIAASTARSNALRDQLLTLDPSLRLIAAGLDNVGRGATDQATAFNSFADAVNRLNTEINTLRTQPPLIIPQLPLQHNAAGGIVNNRFGPRGPDDTLIAARTGEWIVNPESSRIYHPILRAINAGVFPKHFASGGVVNNSSMGDVTINVDGSKSPSTTAKAMLKELQRQKRRGNGGL